MGNKAIVFCADYNLRARIMDYKKLYSITSPAFAKLSGVTCYTVSRIISGNTEVCTIKTKDLIERQLEKGLQTIEIDDGFIEIGDLPIVVTQFCKLHECKTSHIAFYLGFKPSFMVDIIARRVDRIRRVSFITLNNFLVSTPLNFAQSVAERKIFSAEQRKKARAYNLANNIKKTEYSKRKNKVLNLDKIYAGQRYDE